MISFNKLNLEVKSENPQRGVSRMHFYSYRLNLLNALLVSTALASCGQSPDDIATMRVAIDEQILMDTHDVDVADADPLPFAQFEAALLVAVSQNELYRAALAAEIAAKAQVDVASSGTRPPDIKQPQCRPDSGCIQQ